MKKRKVVSTVLAASLALGAFLVPTTGTVDAKSLTEKSTKKIDKKIKQLEKLEQMKEKSNGKFRVSWDEKKGIPRYISGKLSEQNVDVLAFLDENRQVFDLDAGDFTIKQTETDDLGMTQYRTQLTVDGIPVYGSEVFIQVDGDGIITSMIGQVEPKLEQKNWHNSVKLSAEDAIQVAESKLTFTPEADTYTKDPASDLYLYKHENKWMPVYIVELQFHAPYIGREMFYVDAKKGDVLRSFNRIESAAEVGTGTGVLGDEKIVNTFEQDGTYYLYDTSKSMNGVIATYDAENTFSPLLRVNPQPGVYVTDDDNVFDSATQRAGVDAHVYAGVVYDYFLNNHNRDSYDNQGGNIISSVHVGTNYNNAAWTGTQMAYGDGDGSLFTSLSGSLDVVAHELTHAVTDTSANLVYEYESGALNESFSDVFGVLVEAEQDGAADWLLGEDVYTPAIAGDALRSVANPTLYGQPDHMDDFLVKNDENALDWDFGGVHTNSGIPNKALYNIASAIGLEKAGDIYYRALTTHLTSQAQFIDARNALLQSAEDLYGAGGAEYQAIESGFAAVGIDDTTTTSVTDNFEPNNTLSTAHAVESGEIYTSYISSADDLDVYTFTAGTRGQVTVDLTSVPDDYDLYLLNRRGETIAVSQNANTLAESLTYTAAAGEKLYVAIIGYEGVFSTSPYTLSITYP
ncbi:M4 family metallopeptidase [Cytobacillus sp. Hm23]